MNITDSPLYNTGYSDYPKGVDMLHYIPDSDIERFIEEDVPYGDLTTHLLGIGGRRGRITYSTELVELLKEVRAINRAVKISAAGGINETNITEYAATGVDIVVLSSVYFGKPSDIGVRILPVQ